MIHVICPFCQNQVPVVENWSGVMACTRCNRQFAVQQPAAASAAAPPVAGGAAKPAPPRAPAPAAGPGLAAAPVQTHTTAGRSYGRPRRKKQNEMLISLIALIGIVFVGGICAFIFFGPRSEPQPIVSSTAAYEEEAVDETATEPAANEAAEKDESTAEKSTDAKSDATKQRANTDDDAQQNIDVASEEAQHAQHVQRADSDRVVGGGVDGEAAGVAAPADVANDAGIPAGDEQPPEATQDVVRVTIEKNAAKNVLEGMLNLWASGISHASAMSKSPHVAKFALSQWKDRGDELDSYLVSDEKDFYSDSEQRFWVLMEFRNQGAESTRKLYSMTADAQGNWIVEPVEKPQAEVAAEDDDFSEVPKNEFGFGD